MPFFLLIALIATPLHAFPPSSIALPLHPRTQLVHPAPPAPPPLVSTHQQTNIPATAVFQPGISRLRADGFAPLKGKRVGLLTHTAATDEQGFLTIDILNEAPEVKLVALFSPEHGLDGLSKAEERVSDSRYNGLPVYSLYGDTRKPSPRMLKDIDVMVVDLQDIGVRSYTYISAMKYTLAACFERSIPVIVLDRPNPLGGLKVDGPVLDPHFKSYVGLYAIPYIHGLTIGELALLAQDELKPLTGSLTVIKMSGWQRRMLWSDITPTPKWYAPSPVVPTLGAALGYACTGLGSQLGSFRHGYGTEYPFRLLSHPKISTLELKRRLDRQRLPGFAFDPITTKRGNHGSEEGLYIRITNWNSASPIALSLAMLQIAQELGGPEAFDVKNSRQELFCKHWGRAEPLNTLKSNKPLNAYRLAQHWQAEALRWQAQTGRKYWLY